MINVKGTIFETIKDKINKMRFLGYNDPATLKHILYLIVLDDLYDWSDYLEDPQPVQKQLQDLRIQFILNHGEFIIDNVDSEDFYVNVNTPQTHYTWKRVWDAPDLVIVDDVEQAQVADNHAKPFTPDSTCPVSITYFGGEGDLIPQDKNHKPSVDFDTLTICEKMNIYINRETGQMFYLDPETCTWKQVSGEFASAIKWSNIEDRPKIYGGISHNLLPEDSKFNVSLQEVNQDSGGQWDFSGTSDDVAITGTDESIDDVL